MDKTILLESAEKIVEQGGSCRYPVDVRCAYCFIRRGECSQGNVFKLEKAKQYIKNNKEESMKKIEILAAGKWTLRVGTKWRSHVKPEFKNSMLKNGDWIINKKSNTIEIEEDDGHVYEVDFSNIAPLYPTPDMDVPEEGIPFDDGCGKLIDVGKNRFYFEGAQGNMTNEYWVNVELHTYELKQTLPKTVKVCSGCLEVECVCKHEAGTYKVLHCDIVKARYWDGDIFRSNENGDPIGALDEVDYKAIDWENPIDMSKGAWCE